MKVLYFHHVIAANGAGYCLFHLVRALPSEITPVVVLSREGALGDALRSVGVEVLIAPAILPVMGNSNSRGFWRYGNIRFFLFRNRALRACQKICEEKKPDIVHLNTSGFFYLAKGAKKAGVKMVILHIREHWVVKKWDPREWLMRKCASRFVDKIVSISETAAVLFGYPEKTTVVHDWPSFEGRDKVMDMKTEYGISAEKKMILLPGGRTRIKGSLTVLHAMEFVVDKDAVILLLGARGNPSPLKVRIRGLLKRLRIKTYGLRMDAMVEHLGNRVRAVPTTKNIRSLIEQSCMVVSPFTTPHFSMPSIEAGLLRKPVVISDNGYARETVVDGKTGFIVPAGNIRRFADAINRLLSDQALRQKMGDAGFAHITENFDRDVSMKKLMDVYGR